MFLPRRPVSQNNKNKTTTPKQRETLATTIANAQTTVAATTTETTTTPVAITTTETTTETVMETTETTAVETKQIATELKSVEEVAKEVINGKWGNGDERKERLSAAGYNYDEV